VYFELITRVCHSMNIAAQQQLETVMALCGAVVCPEFVVGFVDAVP
jgi:hypothetical protein